MPGCRARRLSPTKGEALLDTLPDERLGLRAQATRQKAALVRPIAGCVSPRNIERAFAASGKRLFPFQTARGALRVQLPGRPPPANNVSALTFLMGEPLHEDPFRAPSRRGASRSQLLADLAVQRRKLRGVRAASGQAAAKTAAKAEAQSRKRKGRSKLEAKGQAQPGAPLSRVAPRRRTRFMPSSPTRARWWSYPLPSIRNLVVITQGDGRRKRPG